MRLLKHVVLWTVCLSWAVAAEAQNAGSLEVQTRTGNQNALIESICSGGSTGQLSFGGSLGYHLTSRTNFGPELMYIRPCERQVFTYQHPRMSAMLQIAHDLTGGPRFRPYLVLGVGMIRHESQYAAAKNRFEVSGGGGLKIFVNKRTFIAPEMQIGGSIGMIRSSVGMGFILR